MLIRLGFFGAVRRELRFVWLGSCLTSLITFVPVVYSVERAGAFLGSHPALQPLFWVTIDQGARDGIG